MTVNFSEFIIIPDPKEIDKIYDSITKFSFEYILDKLIEKKNKDLILPVMSLLYYGYESDSKESQIIKFMLESMYKFNTISEKPVPLGYSKSVSTILRQYTQDDIF